MMMQSPSGGRRQRGLSLVEIMVALFIGLFLTAGILQIFAGTRQTYRFEEALSRIQENGRFALETIARDVRMAGFGGCFNLSSQDEDPPDDTAPIVIEGEIVPNNEPPFQAIPGTDLLTLRHLTGTGVPISAQTTIDSISLESNPEGFSKGQRLAIIDCTNRWILRWIEIFTAEEVTASNGLVSLKPTPPLSRAYPLTPDAITEQPAPQVFRLREVTYFVRTGASGSLALWRRVAPNDPQELVEGVQDMEVLYLIGTDYVPADPDMDWRSANVDGVRISLLLASNDDNLTGVPQIIDWRGNQESRADTRLYQVFTTTIALRNNLD